MTDEKKQLRGGARQGGGRPKQEGDRHMYTVADDAHEWIMDHGGGQYITDTMRTIKAVTEKGKTK